MTEKRVGGNHLAGEKPDGGCQRLAGESGMNGDDRLAGESGRSRHRVLGQRPWHPGIVAGVIDPSELPRAASEVGNRIRHASDEIMQLADEKGKTDEAIIEWKPIAEQTIRAVTPSSEAREANDLRRSEIQSTSYLVVDNVRSTMTGGQSALAGLDSFAMLECYAPASLIIDEWGIDRDSLARGEGNVVSRVLKLAPTLTTRLTTSREAAPRRRRSRGGAGRRLHYMRGAGRRGGGRPRPRAPR